MRNRNRPGKREREARKRRKRVWIVEKENVTLHVNHSYFMHYPEADAVPLKLGRKHYSRYIRRRISMVNDAEKYLAKGVKEISRQHQPESSPACVSESQLPGETL